MLSSRTYLYPSLLFKTTNLFCSIVSPSAFEITNPSSAIFIVGLINSLQSSFPCFCQTCLKPLTLPGTATERPPMNVSNIYIFCHVYPKSSIGCAAIAQTIYFCIIFWRILPVDDEAFTNISLVDTPGAVSRKS